MRLIQLIHKYSLFKKLLSIQLLTILNQSICLLVNPLEITQFERSLFTLFHLSSEDKLRVILALQWLITLILTVCCRLTAYFLSKNSVCSLNLKLLSAIEYDVWPVSPFDLVNPNARFWGAVRFYFGSNLWSVFGVYFELGLCSELIKKISVFYVCLVLTGKNVPRRLPIDIGLPDDLKVSGL